MYVYSILWIRKMLCRFIISANDLQVEKRRYELVKNNTGQRVPLERIKRASLLWNQNYVEDECYFLTEYSLYNEERNTFFHYIFKFDVINKDRHICLVNVQ